MFINPGRSTMLAEAKLGNLNICQIHSICFYLAMLYIFIQYCSISLMTFSCVCNVLDHIYVQRAVTLIYGWFWLSLTSNSNGISQYPQNKSPLWSSKHNMTVCQPRICFKIIYLQFNNTAGPQSALSAQAALFEVAQGNSQGSRIQRMSFS